MNLEDLEKTVAALESQPLSAARSAQARVCLEAAKSLLQSRKGLLRNGFTAGGAAAFGLLGHLAVIPIAAGFVLGRMLGKSVSEADPAAARIEALIKRCEALAAGEVSPVEIDVGA